MSIFHFKAKKFFKTLGLFIDRPLLTIRNRLPLEPIVEDVTDSNEFQVESIPRSNVDPRTVGFTHDYQHGTTIPGFWPGSEHKFGQLTYLDRSHLIDRNPNYGAEDIQEAIHAQAILSGFSWLFGQACYQGFSTYNDITYPLSTQTIVTDGQYWSFYVYQLNTTVNHNLVIDSNPKVNKCWGSPELKLFESIDSNGKLVGFNVDVLKQLVQFYSSVPKERDYEMAPYLDAEEQQVADYEDVEKRTWLEATFKHIFSKRPRHRLLPEIYLWEKIYKVDHNTRPMDARRKFFELNINPWARRLDEHHPAYIPKALREGGKKNKKKWSKTYYP